MNILIKLIAVVALGVAPLFTQTGGDAVDGAADVAAQAQVIDNVIQ